MGDLAKNCDLYQDKYDCYKENLEGKRLNNNSTGLSLERLNMLLADGKLTKEERVEIEKEMQNITDEAKIKLKSFLERSNGSKDFREFRERILSRIDFVSNNLDLFSKRTRAIAEFQKIGAIWSPTTSNNIDENSRSRYLFANNGDLVLTMPLIIDSDNPNNYYTKTRNFKQIERTYGYKLAKPLSIDAK